MTNVLIVEDQRLTREHMESYVLRSGRYNLAGTLGNAALAELFCDSHFVELILMDACTEHDESGIDAAARIKKRFPHIRVIIVTSMVECSFLDRARLAGADSFWYKNLSTEELLAVMDRTMAGESVYPDETPVVQVGLAKSCEFTDKELQVLRLVVEGLEYDDMAEAMGVSERTVKYHISNLLQKTGYKNKLRLAIAVSNKKLIIPSPDRDLEPQT